LIQRSDLGEGAQRPVEYALGNVFHNDIPVAGDSLDNIWRHVLEIFVVDEEKCGSPGLKLDAPCGWEMVARYSIDIVGLDKTLDIGEYRIFLLGLDNNEVSGSSGRTHNYSQRFDARGIRMAWAVQSGLWRKW
jgi:hypothetical protein